MSRKILNLESLIYEQKSRTRAKLNVFEHMLEQCHSQIKRYNSEFKLSECYYSIPLVITGIPACDMPNLINFLVYRLTENGLYSKYVPETNQIYISWKEDDIDLNKYLILKKNVQEVINECNDQVIYTNKKKDKQVKTYQYEREKQFQRNIQRTNVNPTSFEEFVKKF